MQPVGHHHDLSVPSHYSSHNFLSSFDPAYTTLLHVLLRALFFDTRVLDNNNPDDEKSDLQKLSRVVCAIFVQESIGFSPLLTRFLFQVVL